MTKSKEKITIQNGSKLMSGYEEISEAINQLMSQKNHKIIAIECYPTTNEALLLEKIIQPLQGDYVLNAADIFLPSAEINQMISASLTEDRVFGKMTHNTFEDFIDQEKFSKQQKLISEKASNDEKVVIYGVGASLFERIETLVYSDLTRWEVQSRYKSQKYSNWQGNNAGEDPLKMIKRGYYFEWNLADRQKRAKLSEIDFYLDLHREEAPQMMKGTDYLKALDQVVSQPFSLVPFYESGIWGGTWMQTKFGVGQEEPNLAWCFNGVPEENSLLLEVAGELFETPAINLVFLRSEELLGQKVQGRFGQKFPIRFNFLDTINGGNLSLQVHPKLDYAQEVFGASYTQDESYYVMEAEEDAVVYLGVKDGVKKEELMSALELAAQGQEIFDDQQYIYHHKMTKHDHYSIPSGTIHSSGKNSVILEISATPNRFTFKLWDWGRVDFDGLPRPVHLEHGEKNIDFYKDETWVNKELINPFEVLTKEHHYLEEKTGLHETEFIETRRHSFNKTVTVTNHGSVNVLCLVEGESGIISCPNESFKPFTIDYGQVVIIPEQIRTYQLSPEKPEGSSDLKVIQAFVK